MQKFNVKPANKALLVRDPITRTPLAGKGELKPRNGYWLRRVIDGSVIEMKGKNKSGEAL
jgi:hypothetical protein